MAKRAKPRLIGPSTTMADLMIRNVNPQIKAVIIAKIIASCLLTFIMPIIAVQTVLSKEKGEKRP